mgnify:CR=1 FL=1
MEWIEKWLVAKGVAADGFTAYVLSLAETENVPEIWRAKAASWLQEHTQLSAEEIMAFVTLAYIELNSGHPGWNRDAGGIA